MKKCEKCGYTTEREAKFCPQCGSLMAVQHSEGSEDTVVLKNICPKCHTPVSDPNSKYCYKCGASLNSFAGYESTFPPYANNRKFQNRNLSNHLSSFETAINKKIHIGSDNIRILIICIVSILVMVVVVSVLAVSIHKCDECGDIYFGKKNTISFFGVEEDVCDDCYDDFYSFF